MTMNSFDSVFNAVASAEEILYKGHARTALKYAHFDLDNIDNVELAKKIIIKALASAHQDQERAQKSEKTALTFPSMGATPNSSNPTCPRCGSTKPMQSTELLGNVKALYCPMCRLTEIA